MYLLKRKTSTGDTRYQARVYSGKDQAGRQIFLVRTFATRRAANAWGVERETERDERNYKTKVAGKIALVRKPSQRGAFTDLLASHEVAEILRTSEGMVRSLTKRRILPGAVYLGDMIRWDAAKLREFIEHGGQEKARLG